MNAMMMQRVFGAVAEARERAKVVGISNPEYQEATPADMLFVVLFFVVCILVVAGIIVGIVMLYRHFKGKGASGAAGRMPSASQPAQATATATRFCTSCGASIPQASKFCPKCGADLGQRQ